MNKPPELAAGEGATAGGPGLPAGEGATAGGPGRDGDVVGGPGRPGAGGPGRLEGGVGCLPGTTRFHKIKTK